MRTRWIAALKTSLLAQTRAGTSRAPKGTKDTRPPKVRHDPRSLGNSYFLSSFQKIWTVSRERRMRTPRNHPSDVGNRDVSTAQQNFSITAWDGSTSELKLLRPTIGASTNRLWGSFSHIASPVANQWIQKPKTAHFTSMKSLERMILRIPRRGLRFYHTSRLQTSQIAFKPQPQVQKAHILP